MNEKQTKKQTPRSGRPAVDRERRARVGQTIRKYRTEAGMDQAALAAKLGLTKTAVGNWELGLSRPDVDTVPRLCEILRVPVTELLGIPGEAALAAEDRAVLEMYRRLDRFNRHTVRQVMDRLLFQQDSKEKARLRDAYRGLCLYEEAAAAGIGAPMTDDAGSRTVYVPRSKIPGNADAVIHVNGASMEPTYPNGSYVYVSTEQRVAYGQTGIFIVNGEGYIKEYRRDGLHSHNPEYRVMRFGEDSEVRCVGRVLGRLEEQQMLTTEEIEELEANHELSD